MDPVSFTINGEVYQVNGNTVPSYTSLNSFIRNQAHLTGTKFMCAEGGCGACIVTVKGMHPVTKDIRTWAVNSCLTPVFSCHGMDVITVEGIGNNKIGYHQTQKRLTNLNGTQCGYCSPGMVMNMYSLLESNNGNITMKEIENSFGGNMCRCTGYRPILDAFKSLATDADKRLTDLCKDIEDLDKVCPKTGSPCAGKCKSNSIIQLEFNEDNKQWYTVFMIQQLFDVFDKIGNSEYMLVGGNTAHGVYRRNETINTFIDINGIEELRGHSIGNELIIGGMVNLTETMDILMKTSKVKGFEYCEHLWKHIDLIANVPVRNSGTIAGNLSIKHQRNEFPSDLFIMLEGVGSKLTILEKNNTKTICSLADYLKMDMKKKIISNVILPSLDANRFKFRSYKIMPRAQNAHAYVNAAFLLETSTDNTITSAKICFGGINPDFIHANETEAFLVGKNLYENSTIQSAYELLTTELKPDWVLPDAEPQYRKNLAIALFYKFILHTSPPGIVKENYISGGPILDRPVSTGTQLYDTKTENYPLTQPVPKYEGLIQCSGEALYANDLPHQHGELWAAFVPSTVANGKILKIDPTEILKHKGVHAFFSAKDIPGVNNFCSKSMFFNHPEEIFVGVDSDIQYYGQPIGVILADNIVLANYAANKVKIQYEKEAYMQNDASSSNGATSPSAFKWQQKPGGWKNIEKVKHKQIVPTINDAYELNATDRFIDMPFNIESVKIGENIKHSLKGSFKTIGQYHYTMEPQTTVCIPSDDGGLDVYASTQAMDFTHVAISEVLLMPQNKINMIVKRLGGGYGGKISRASQIACACALACYLTNRTVRFVLSLESNMNIIGKRYGCISEYEVDVDENGIIQKLKNKYGQDYGCNYNEPVQFNTTTFFKNCYTYDSWDVKSVAVRTDSPSNTWCRAPGSTEGIAMIENIMEHIARVVGKDPNDVRLANMADDSDMKKLLPDFMKQIDYQQRKNEIDTFNRNNRWRKRGIAIVPMKYPQEYFGNIPVFVAIYHKDGTVVVSHGGIEMGQGINTKVAQVTAHVLGVPLEYISIKPTNNVISANATVTGGSMTSEVVCHAVKVACEELLERMKPVRAELKDPKWTDLTKACYEKLIDLSAKYMYKVTDLKTYNTWGLSSADIEVDLLTGNIQIHRVDILEDTGESLSPLVDVGQIEGAFIMGVGYWLHENIVYDRNNGKLLTDRTWTYKPPGAKDIPLDFRVTFMRNNPNPFGVLRSKATGEPSLCMSVVVIFALRYALNAGRADAGLTEPWFNLKLPLSPDILFLNAGNSIKDFLL